MTSRRLPPLSSQHLIDVVRAVHGRAPTTITGLGGGTANACFALGFGAPGEDVILKVGPPASTPALACEVGAMSAEVDFYERAAARGVPVPRVLVKPFEMAGDDRSAFIMTKLGGRTLSAVGSRVSRRRLQGLRRSLGAMAGTLGVPDAAENAFFGHVGNPHLRGPTWRSAFSSMWEALLEDALRFRASLPVTVPQLRTVVERHLPLFEGIPRSLVHFDLWDGNVMVDVGAGEARLVGIVDGERCFWGDACAELASLCLFSTLEDRQPLLAAWHEARQRGAGIPRPEVSDEEFARRFWMYQLYLYTIMAVEMSPRGHIGIRHLPWRWWVGRALRRVFTSLETTS